VHSVYTSSSSLLLLLLLLPPPPSSSLLLAPPPPSSSSPSSPPFVYSYPHPLTASPLGAVDNGSGTIGVLLLGEAIRNTNFSRTVQVQRTIYPLGIAVGYMYPLDICSRWI
jgi:hypothetical protein